MERLGDVTAVVLTCQRHANLPRIVDELRRQNVPTVVWNNKPEVSIDLGPDIPILSSGRNTGTFGRFVCAGLCRTALIFTCDDDCIPGDVATLAESVKRTGKLTTYLDAGHIAWSKKNHYWLGGCPVESFETLLGWGSCFRREWISVLLRYIAFFGEADEVLMSKADRIFTLLLCQPHIEIEREITHLSGARSPDALYRQINHKELIEGARERCRVLLRRLGGSPIGEPDG
jgi:hypothetical protein